MVQEEIRQGVRSTLLDPHLKLIVHLKEVEKLTFPKICVYLKENFDIEVTRRYLNGYYLRNKSRLM